MMAQTAALTKDEPPIEPALPPRQRSEPRRFDLPDLDRHPWIVERLRLEYPHVNDRHLIGWLRAIIYQSEYLFLCLPHGVALAQIVKTITLEATPFVQERFVWVEDKSDPEQVADAAAFYSAFETWGRHQGCSTMFVEHSSDVPHDAVKEKLGRVFTQQRQFVRL